MKTQKTDYSSYRFTVKHLQRNRVFLLWRQTSQDRQKSVALVRPRRGSHERIWNLTDSTKKTTIKTFDEQIKKR